MTFAHRLSRRPRAVDPDRGAEASALFPDLPEAVRDLLHGAAGSSPYLKGLMEREAAWLEAALGGAPEAALDDILAAAGALDDRVLSDGLRTAKRRVALLAGLADLGGVWPLEAVTGALTRLADLAAHRALLSAVAGERGRGKLPETLAEDAAGAGGAVVLAMGKMGAFELNYSSDIDLICLFDEGAYAADDYLAARGALVRAVRKMAALLSETTAGGYVFRTDLRLRPDPSVTPVCLSMEAALRYYESLGRTWERAAHIKARPAAGDRDAGAAYLERLRPFVWRRHLDFAAIQDAHDMRLRIREHKGLGGQRPLEGHDLKLGRGGIREIEFFTQTRQMIAGGRDPSLRVRGTVEGLARLAEADWIPQEVAQQLTEDYRAHRMVEHRLQMIADAQTHSLPTDAAGFDRLAALMGVAVDGLRRDIAERIDRVAGLTEGFFAPDARAAPAADTPDLPDAARETVARWRSYPALRSARAVEIFQRIRPTLLDRLMRGGRPEQALLHFDGFLRGLPAGVQVFSLFEANPQLIDLIADIADTAPDLAQYLSRNAGVFDAVIGGDFFAPWPGVAGLRGLLSERITAAPDYEAQLDAARRWAKEWHFRIGVHHLRGLIAGDEAGTQYADLAEATVAALWPAVIDAFAAKHGAPPGDGAAVLGMGSLGAGALTAKSDLDLIVIYDAPGDAVSDGRRPLSARPYYARLTQALVTALSAPTAEGKLYEVDMRLRPSGRQGPVATALAAFDRYQREDAWTWEHLALTRARPIAGPEALAQKLEEVRCAVLDLPRDRAAVLADVAEMRARLSTARPGHPWDPKAGPGRMQEIDLAANAAALLSRAPARATAAQLAAGADDLLGPAAVDDLTQAHALFFRVQAAARLLSGDRLNPAELGAGGEALLLRETGAADLAALEAEMARRADAAAERIAAMLAPTAAQA
ncbi:glutamine-synthetase adenylyltransferase [Rhodobacteraceae bacterium CCMM004]|nr:glutamine-synthetase adenylyltransferase [Rhodobacteraceae bacterium CCMM004]